MSFADLGLPESLLKTLSEQSYTKPYPIQEQAIPAVLKGKDVLGIAQTGSGKTASYVLPILSILETKPVPKNRHPDVLIVVPTRELAMQVGNVVRDFSIKLPQHVKSKAVYGGVSINPQMITMQGVSLLIATPGRLLDLIQSKAVHLSEIKILVLDEADKMLNMGFKDEMNQIFDLLPPKRQNLLFSATLSKDIDQINQVLLTDPQVIKIEPKGDQVELINQVAYRVTDERKGPLLRYLVKSQNLNQVLVFVSSVNRAEKLLHKLQKNQIDALAIHGKKSHGARGVALSEFKSGRLQVLIATDLLARGIDIEFLPYVINYELPRSPKDYVHRIGRTGRAESPGEAISFVTPDDEHHFKVIQKKMKKWVTMLESDDLDLHGY